MQYEDFHDLIQRPMYIGKNKPNLAIEKVSKNKKKSGGKLTEFHLSAFKGEIYSVTNEEVPDTPPPPKPRYSMYGEEVDAQPSMWKEGD